MTLRHSTLGFSVLTAALLLPASFSSGAKKAKGPPPAISRLTPSGGKAGSTFPCTVGGTLAKSDDLVPWRNNAFVVGMAVVRFCSEFRRLAVAELTAVA